MASLLLAPWAWGQPTITGPANPPAQTVVLPPGTPDPLEPFNRAVWEFNKGLMIHVVRPTAKGYRTVVAKPVRTGIGNMGTNITYPDRLINNMLQGKWKGARDETCRFLINSTVGIAGFWDVASKWKIPKSPADFGQTFGQWGWKANFFLMLPLFGPSNDRDAVGLAADYATQPMIYFSPYTLEFENPLTYTGPYNYFTYGVAYNNLTDVVDGYARFSEAEMDPYSELAYVWTFVTANRVANFQVTGKQDPSSLETLESVFFTYKNPEFPDLAKTRSVLIPTTGRNLKFTYWLQPGKKSRLVYIVPGLGSHRLAETAMALAELVYSNGYTAVTVSSPFNSEFIDNASTADVPGYLPVDGSDLAVALAQIDHRLNEIYPGRFEGKELMGYSMGAFETLYLAAQERTNKTPAIQFDRFLAVDTPVRLLHGVKELDDFYDAPLAWPPDVRTVNMENTFLKVADLSKNKLTPRTTLPFDAIESQFLIGATFRFILRDIIYSTQRRHDLGVLHQPVRYFRRDSLYREIMRYSFADYFQDFVVPYYRGFGMTSPQEKLQKAGDLRSYDAALRDDPKIRVTVNENDFLLAPEDLAWLHDTFPPDQLTVFPEGGHLGNLGNPQVQKTILTGLSVLPPPPPGRPKSQ